MYAESAHSPDVEAGSFCYRRSLMRTLAACIVAFCAVGLSAQRAASPAPARVPHRAVLQPGDIVVTGGQLFDGVRNTLVPNTGLVIRQGICLEVGASPTNRPLNGATEINVAATETILPGLFDLHAHYAVDLFGEG